MHAQTIIHIEEDETLTALFDSPERYSFRTNDLIAGISDEVFDSSKRTAVRSQPRACRIPARHFRSACLLPSKR